MLDTDDQTLSLSGSQLSIADGNTLNLSPAITSLQPWFGQDDNAGATINTENVYTLGNVGIGTNAPAGNLHLQQSGGPITVFTNPTGTVGQQGMRLAFDNDRMTFQRATD